MLKLFVGTTLLLGTVPAIAQVQPVPQQTAVASKKSSDRLVCRSIEQIGSRLASKRVCMTARQWDEQRRTDRENVEGSQQRSFQPSGG